MKKITLRKKVTGLLLVLLLTAVQAYSQNLLTGKVVAADNDEPLPGVSIIEKNTLNGTVTNVDGEFSITISPGALLEFSYVGYLNKVVEPGDKENIEVFLSPDVRALDELIVIGYSSVRRKDLTGSIAIVDVEDAKTYKGTTITEGLAGKVPGVTVLSTGQPGSTPRILIRGLGHFGNNSPLYVIDGIQTNEQRDLNPEDVESIQILKDASAAALYGSRAANGVVVITTKTGKSGAPKITFNTSGGIEQASKIIPMMNAAEFAELNNMAYDNAGLPRMPGADAAFDPDIDTDWQDAFMKNGRIQKYDFSYSGGNSEGNYLLSAGYFTQDGIVKGPEFERYSIRLNSGISKKRLRINQTMFFSNTSSDNLYYGFGNPFMDMLRMLPTIPVYDNTIEGGFGIGSEANKTFGTNPVALQELNDDKSNTNKIMGNISAELEIFPFLSYKFNTSLELADWHNRRYRKRGLESYNRPQPYDELHENRGRVSTLMYENTLNFTQSFNDHNLFAVIGVSKIVTDWKQIGGSVFDFPKPYPVMSSGTRDRTIYGSDAKVGILGYLGRVTYNYKGKYLITANFRRDGSSKFGPSYKWGNFPGVSAGWVISEERFFNYNWINNLKIRGSYGLLGNSDLRGDYNYTSYINPSIAYPLGPFQDLAPGAITQLLSNPDLRWQSKTLSGAGIDASLLNNSIIITFDYFNSITDDVLVNAPIPWTSGHYGGPDPYSNVGKIKNHGVELAITYQQMKSEFSYDVTTNISMVRNEVLRLSEGYDAIFFGPTKTTVGMPIGQFFVLRTDGIFQNQEEVLAHTDENNNPIQPNAMPGDIRYKDLNGRDPETGELTGEPDGVINLDDREFAGSPWPDFEFGLTGNVSYKNWEMRLFFEGSYGNMIFSNTRAVMERMDDNSNYPTWLVPWTEENQSDEYPRALYGAAAANNVYYESDRWLDNGSYLRLRSLRLGYDIPVNSMKTNVFIQMQNVFTISSYKMWDVVHPGDVFTRGIDNGTYPNVRSFIIGLNLTY
ncbi:MAG: TonB-dependent receptor [Bacteroidales bacterium]|nr:TonB-dependent receptor [Bacteroidales bacterium]